MPEEESAAKKWNDWDREGRQVEIAVAPSQKSLRISAALQDQEIGFLEAKSNGESMEIAELYVQPEASFRPESGLFRKARVIACRKNGIGGILVRALVAFARKNDLKQITGTVLDKHHAENRYILEWFSKRGFIIDKTPASGGKAAGTVATFRMII